MIYEILEHRADLKIRVFGKTKKELFKNAMVAMFEVAEYEPEKKDTAYETRQEIKIESFDLSSLLVDFLSEVLYFCETKKEVYHDIEFKKFTEKKLEAILIGKKLKQMRVHIKAVTYHDLILEQKKDGAWMAEVLFDI